MQELDPPLEVPPGAKVEVFNQGLRVGVLWGRDGYAKPALN